MAATALTIKQAKANDIVALEALAAFDATDGCTFIPSGSHTMVVLYNSDSTNAEEVTLKVPANKNIAIPAGDYKVSVAKSSYAVLYVESMLWADESSGKVTLKGSADVKALAFNI